MRCVSLSRSITDPQVLVHDRLGNGRRDAAATAAILDYNGYHDPRVVKRCEGYEQRVVPLSLFKFFLIVFFFW